MTDTSDSSTADRMRCDRPMCAHFRSRWEGDGGTTFLCNRVPGLVLGGINLVEYDEPHEIDGCHSSRKEAGDGR